MEGPAKVGGGLVGALKLATVQDPERGEADEGLNRIEVRLHYPAGAALEYRHHPDPLILGDKWEGVGGPVASGVRLGGKAGPMVGQRHLEYRHARSVAFGGWAVVM